MIKNDKKGNVGLLLSVGIAVATSIISVGLVVENNKLKESLRNKGNEVESLEKDVAEQDQMLKRIYEEKIKLRHELDSVGQLLVIKRSGE